MVRCGLYAYWLDMAQRQPVADISLLQRRLMQPRQHEGKRPVSGFVQPQSKRPQCEAGMPAGAGGLHAAQPRAASSTPPSDGAKQPAEEKKDPTGNGPGERLQPSNARRLPSSFSPAPQLQLSQLTLKKVRSSLTRGVASKNNRKPSFPSSHPLQAHEGWDSSACCALSHTRLLAHRPPPALRFCRAMQTLRSGLTVCGRLRYCGRTRSVMTPFKLGVLGRLPQCRLIYATIGVEVEWWCKRLMDPELAALGWDIEWKVTFQTGAHSTTPPEFPCSFAAQ